MSNYMFTGWDHFQRNLDKTKKLQLLVKDCFMVFMYLNLLRKVSSLLRLCKSWKNLATSLVLFFLRLTNF